MVISCSAYGCKNKWSKQTAVHFHKYEETFNIYLFIYMQFFAIFPKSY